MRVTCPHCEKKANIRTSKHITAITRELYYQCSNVNCGHTWVALISAIRTIVPSQTPNPKVYIPTSERSSAAQAAAPPSG